MEYGNTGRETVYAEAFYEAPAGKKLGSEDYLRMFSMINEFSRQS